MVFEFNVTEVIYGKWTVQVSKQIYTCMGAIKSASVGLAQTHPDKTLAAKLYVLQTVGTRHDYHRIYSDVSSLP